MNLSSRFSLGKKKKVNGNTKHEELTKLDTSFDVDFYRETYSDLAGMSDDQLVAHWEKFGKKEKRFGNSPDLPDFNFDFELDFAFYTSYYQDLCKSNIRTLNEAKIHWLNHGKKEQRFRTIKDLTQAQNISLYTEPYELDFDFITEANKSSTVTYQNIIDLCVGKISFPIVVYATSKDNASFYKTLGEKCIEDYEAKSDQQLLHKARTAWRASLFFDQSSEVVELLGNSYLQQGDFRSAQRIYEQAAIITASPSITLIDNILSSYERTGRIHEAIDFLCEARKKMPSLSLLMDKLDSYAQKLYFDYAGDVQINATLDKRGELKALASECSRKIYNAYCEFYGGEQRHIKPGLNLKKILIVGDFNVEQCVRYRIDQKVEQLGSQGVTVTTVDWLKLEENKNALALHDVVIFYRVPAVPRVLKAMAQVNSTGRASFYEIDDLLFEELYPAPIDTFGGYISIDTHIELRKSMASFYAAASYCRYGIASTRSLCEKLGKLVKTGQCLLHRNGLDSLNIFRVIDKGHKNTVDIFYGSGTQAHNSDFIDQALPALENILKKYPQARLIIAGYLQLPEDFTSSFKGQLKQIPPVKNVKAYWSFLEQADINLAVLHDDEINGCKSELKWFEAACFGIPSILSSTDNYRDVIRNGEDAFLADNHQDWSNALEVLVTQPQKRAEIAQNALNRIKSEYTVEVLGESLVEDLNTSLMGDIVKTRKKIALVNVFFPPQAIGGATRVVSDNFDTLREKYSADYDVVVFTSDDHCTTPYQLTTYQHNGSLVYRSTILYRENMDWHPKDQEMYNLFSDFLETEKPDLIHFHCVQRLTASIVEAAKDAEVPYIVTAHDAWWISDHQFLVDQNDKTYPEGHTDIFAERTLPNNVSFGESVERLMYFRELLKGAVHLLTVSESFADIYRKNGYEEIAVNKNGISSTIEWKQKQTDYTDKVVCAHIGGMSNHKGYYLLKQAIEDVQPKNIEMLVVDHSKAEGYEHRTLWGEVPVVFIGRISQSAITQLYQRIDVLFAPSIWPESYGLVTREASASGCWVVASSIGGIGEDVVDRETGFVFDPVKQNALDGVIKSIDEDRDRYKQSVSNNSPRYSDSQVENLIGFYKDI